MKKIPAVFIIAALLLLACEDGEEPASQSDETALQVIDTTNDDHGTAVTDAPEEAAPSPLYPEGTLDPSTIIAETTVNAVALYESYFIWDGKKVTVEGYPYIPYLADSMVVNDEIELIAEPGGDRDILATAVFADSCGTTIWADQPITVCGTIEYTRSDEMEIIDAMIISDASPALKNILTSPYTYDGDTPILVRELYYMFSIWIGKELTVEGYFKSITTSTLSDCVIVRIDLGGSGSDFTKYVACEMMEEISEETDSIMAANRAGTQIRGVVAGKTSSMVGLENCWLVNR